jgi:succinate dehydrogenase/fumarate reductase flavoprotein subunit
MAGHADQHFDVVVVGSGAGGLAAAITAKLHGLNVVVLEKAAVIGGTSAVSGGWSWIPCSPLARQAGINDSLDEARLYIRHQAGRFYDADRVNAYLENGPKMVEFFERSTELKFFLGTSYPDYQSNVPGAKPGGRPLLVLPYDGRRLGNAIHRLRPPLPVQTFNGMMIGSGSELLHFFNATRSLRSAVHVGRLFLRYFRDRLVHGRTMRLTNGNALVGRLLKTANDLDLPIWTSSPARELLIRDGKIAGVKVAREGAVVDIVATRGVVLAAGGFPRNAAMRQVHYPHVAAGAEHWSLAPGANTGDGIVLAESAGGELVTGLPNPAAYVPASLVPKQDGTFEPFPSFVQRGRPGVIAVTRKGRRFTNEANDYHSFVQAMLAATAGEEERCAFLILDHRAIRKYGLDYVKPFPMPLKPHLRSGYLTRANTLAELASKTGIDASALETTVAEFNKHARHGRDPEFGRGENIYNSYLADPLHKPNPNLAPVEAAPFYAMKIVPGDIGTFVGLKTNANAQVVNADGKPIVGLYAVGNDAASIMGGTYPGSGITLGPALTFGYLAATHMVGLAAPA